MLDTPGGVAITIHNLQARLTYVKLGDRGWAARPVAERALDPPRQELRLPASQVEVVTDPVLGAVFRRSTCLVPIARIKYLALHVAQRILIAFLTKTPPTQRQINLEWLREPASL